MLNPPIRYAAARDGTRIAYWTSGEGPPLVYLSVPCCSHVQHELDHPVLVDWYTSLAEHVQLVRMDLRGYGASQRDHVQLGIREFGDDILAVADALRLPEFTLLSQGGSTPAVIQLAAGSPRVKALVLCDGWADGPNLPAHQQVATAESLIEKDYRMFSRLIAQVVLGAPEPLAGRIAWLLQQSATVETWRAFSELFRTTDVTARMAEVTCPTLVIHSGPSPVNGHGEESIAMARAIPTARLLSFDVSSFPLSAPGTFKDAIVEFITSIQGDHGAPRMDALSPREQEIVDLIARGWTNQRIAEELVLAKSTVKTHVSNVISKLGFVNRTEVAAWARTREAR